MFLMWSCLLCMSFWAGERLDFGERLTLAVFVQGAQFQCRLFPVVQALIFGAHVVLIGAMMLVSLHVAWWSWSFRALLYWC